MTVSQTQLSDISQEIQQNGFSRLPARTLSELTNAKNLASFAQHWMTLHASWDDLRRDEHLKDGGTYRLRRHSCFIQDLDQDALTQTPHRAHWQPTEFNALHGGYDRMFQPIDQKVADDPAFKSLMVTLGKCFAQIHPTQQWFIEAHQFRINTSGGIGRPTPEGAHRDGVDFVVVMMLGRHHVKGGETRVFMADGPTGVRFVMDEPFCAILLDDAKVIHETTPIQPESATYSDCYRDTLVLTFRADAFLAAESN